MADAKFTKAEIVAWSEETSRRLTPELLSKAPNGQDWDRGIIRTQDKERITLSDNEYGLKIRTYPIANVARIDETGHW